MGHHYSCWCRNYRWRNLFTITEKNDELAAADKVMGGNQKKGKQVLNVNAKVIKPQSLTDEFTTTGVLLPDEEVDLSFETSGKIVEINFEEGTA